MKCSLNNWQYIAYFRYLRKLPYLFRSILNVLHSSGIPKKGYYVGLYHLNIVSTFVLQLSAIIQWLRAMTLGLDVPNNGSRGLIGFPA